MGNDGWAGKRVWQMLVICLTPNSSKGVAADPRDSAAPWHLPCGEGLARRQAQDEAGLRPGPEPQGREDAKGSADPWRRRYSDASISHTYRTKERLSP